MSDSLQPDASKHKDSRIDEATKDASHKDAVRNEADTEPDTLPQTPTEAQQMLRQRALGPDDTPVTLAAEGHQPTAPHINNYRLIQPIGEGGMGSVWLAEQDEPVRRRVAVKVIKAGLDTTEVIARFEAERQALAMMDHPNIARILDAGSTDAGRPFFVMEYIEGQPLTKYADAHSLSMRERLSMFATVCRAVQHAHQKGVIHRDIKPSNVLVTTHDKQPVVKIIDFGLAKAMDSTLTDKTVLTVFGMPMGTLIYASPEQVEGRLPDIDTRSDVFSLGVTLYELLTGSTPIDRELYKSASAQEIAQLICDEDPPKPSSRLSDSGDKLKSISSLRGTRPHQLQMQVRGELDWIVMRSIERDRNRRYQSPSDLADDIERFLTGQPIEAGPPQLSYRAKKFVKRNRMAVALGSIAIATLIVSSIASLMVASTISAKNKELVKRNEEIEGLLAKLRTKNDEVEKQNTALREKAVQIEGLATLANDSIGSFLVEMTQDPRMLGPTGSNVRRDRLQEAQTVLAQVSALANDRDAPNIEGKTHLYKAMTDAELGNLEEAVDELGKAVTKLQSAGQDDASLILLANAYRNLGFFNMQLGRYVESESAHEESARLLKMRSDDNPEALLELGIELTYYGELRLELAQYASALKKFLEAKRVFDQLAEQQLVEGERLWTDWMYFRGMNLFNIAIGYEHANNEDAARSHFVEAVQLYDLLVEVRPDQPRNHSRRVRAYLNLASDFHETNEFKNAKKTALTAHAAANALTQYPQVFEYQFQIARSEFVLFVSHMYLGEERDGLACAKRGLEKIEAIKAQFDSFGDKADLLEDYESAFRSVLP